MTICERQSGGRILCIRLSGLGDVVHSLNALSLLRHHRPHAEITWVVEKRFADLLHGHPYIDEVVEIPRTDWEQMLRNPLRWTEMLPEFSHLAHGLRLRRFDASIDFQSSLKSAWIVAAAGAPLRVGFAPPVSRELNWLVQNRLVSVPRGCHRIERYLALLAPLGIPTRFMPGVVPCAEEHRAAIEPVLEKLARPLAIVHPGTSGFAAFKRWMPERYSELANRLVCERGAGVLVTWGPGERELAERIVEMADGKARLSPELTDLRQLAHLLSRADLFIGCDTGPMHLASVLGVPVVALFGPKDPLQTGPYCSRSEVVTAPVECRPCSKRRCSDVRCMTGITVEQVFEAACSVLDGKGELRARDGLIHKPFALSFELGRWNGRSTSCYSAPEFYRWLSGSGVTAGIQHECGRVRKRTYGPVAVDVAGERRELVVKKYKGMGGIGGLMVGIVAGGPARRAYRAALRLQGAGIPVPFHVCYMQKGAAWKREGILVREALPHALTLRQWLTADRMRNWRSLTPQQKLEFLDTVARFIREFHRKQFYHGDLMDKNIMILWHPKAPAPSLYADGVGATAWVGWLPAFLRDVACGVDLRRFLSNLSIALDERSESRLFDSYFEGFIESLPRQRFIRWVVGTFSGGMSGLKRSSGQGSASAAR